MKKYSLSSGFTLIELLIVIAVLGVLATVVLVAINPLEQLARGRDAGRKSTLGQLSRALQSYYTSQNAVYPAVNATWINSIIAAGEIKSLPPLVNYSVAGSTPCGPATGRQNNYCYNSNTTEVIVYTRLESSSEENKCPGPPVAYFIYVSSQSQAGVICNTGDPLVFGGYSFIP